jgi:putative membrane protein
MYYYDNFYPTHMFGFGGLFMFIFWGIIIYVIITFVRSDHVRKEDRSMEILKERYAKGEITKEQFEVMKKDLK